ncbi:ABC transporter substrate-binding protein [Microlunatus parietis]|uniref:Peptide/nickel transport system substrate-binding protein n=1 Tax=Microlunatus parietis TaxID=682979 RepID=A0A7Y9I4C5_9ACTN|nr:ABC transporter substrate-binding protein [Microlunatus parietis]NYE69760.1 peptide/nickel transport system substrate-binding protein [Microlunatus parietis]
MTRRLTGRLLAVATSAALALTLAAGCSTERTVDGGAGGPSGGASTVDTLNMTASAATPTFARNWNPFSPVDKKSPASGLIYEPLIRINHTQAKKPEPWLAESFAWSDDGKKLTFTLRSGITWSDGKPFTSADVKYTFEIPAKHDNLGLAVPFDKVEAPDERTVVVTFDDVSYQKIDWFGGSAAPALIVPAHIWQEQDPSAWTNPEPVGTGPVKLEAFSPQQVTFAVRDDYWNGQFKMKKINIKPFASPEAGKAMMLKGDLDWSTMSWADADKQFVAKNPETNKYWAYSTGGAEGLDFNNARPPLDDVHVRRALYYAIDAEKILALNKTGQQVTNPTGLSDGVWHDLIAPEFAGKKISQRVDEAKAELAKSSYRLEGGALTKDGKSYPLTIKPVVEYSNWAAWGQGLAQQWKETLGVEVKVVPTPETQLFNQIAEGDYHIAFDWMYGGNTQWASFNNNLGGENYVPVGEKANANYGRFKSAEADELLKQLYRAEDPNQTKEQGYQLQRIQAEQVPYAPLFTAAWFIEVNATNWTGWPDPASPESVPHTLLGPDTILTIRNLTPAR